MQLSYNPTWQISGFTLLSCFKFPGGWLGQCTSTMLRQEFRCSEQAYNHQGHNILEQAIGQVSRLKHVVFALGQDVNSTVRFNIEWVLNTHRHYPTITPPDTLWHIIRLHPTLSNKKCEQEQLFISNAKRQLMLIIWVCLWLFSLNHNQCPQKCSKSPQMSICQIVSLPVKTLFTYFHSL